MILQNNQIFVLHTAHTTYAFHVLPSGQLEHLYYGRKIRVKEPLTEESIAALVEKHSFPPGTSNVYSDEHKNFSLDDMRLEMSAYGKGDMREPFVEVIHADGSYTSDYVFDGFCVYAGKEPYETLPGSYDEKNEVEHLCITLKDKNADLKLELHYYVYADCDVITTDSISHTVSWGGKKDISALKNSGVSLKIYSENSDIYSFEFGEPTKSVYTESETEDGSKLVGSVVEGGEFELPESTYTKEGYAFKGWKVLGSEEILKPGDKVTVEDDMTLTSAWNLYGDFDGDDKVDAKETSMVREYLIGKPDAEFIKEFADVNTDGDVDICDLVVFIKNLK